MISLCSIWIVAVTAGCHLIFSVKDTEALQFTSAPGDQTVVVSYNNSHIEMKWTIDLQGKIYDRTRIFKSMESGFGSNTLLYFNRNPQILAGYQNKTNANVTNVVDSGTVTVTLVIRNVTLSDESYYKVQVEDTGGTQTTNIMFLTVYVPPSVDIYSERQNYFENETITLHCNATGKPTPSISWIQVNNPSRSFPDGSSLTIPAANESDAGQYKCIATNSAGSDTASINITVIPFSIPSFDFVSSNQTAVIGSNVNLYCNASGYPTPKISWTREGNDSVISANNGLTLSQVTREDSGLYICTAVNHMGNKEKVVFVDVQFAPEISQSPQSIIFNESDSMLLFCNASGNPPAVITWTKEGDSNFREHGEKLLLTNATKNDKGTYICTAFNGIGQNATANATVTVQYKPRGTVIQSNLTNNLVEKPAGIKLNCTADAVPMPHLYKFFIDDKNLGESSIGVLEISSDSLPYLSTIKCVPHNRYWTGEEAEINVTVYVAPEISQSPQSIIVNESDSKLLFCNASGNPPAVITWTKKGDSNFRRTGETLLLTNVTRNDKGTYICTAFNGIWQNATANATVTVQYKPRGTVIQSNLTNNLVEKPAGIKLNCTADAIPTPNLYEFFIDSNKLGESSDGVLELSSDSLPCLSTIKCVPHSRYWTGEVAEINITVHVEPVIVSSSLSGVHNESNNVILFCNATGNPPPMITWKKTGGSLFHHSGESLILTNISKSNTGMYVCTASNGVGKNDSRNGSVVVQYTPLDTMLRSNATNDTVIRPGVIAFNCTADSFPSPLSYDFYKDDSLLGSSADGTYVISSEILPYHTTIRCIPRNLLGPGIKVEMNVIVHVAPQIANHTQNQTVNETESIALFCNVSGNPSPKVTWTKKSAFIFSGNKLKLTNVTKDDRGTYICTASNGIGEDVSVSLAITVHYKPRNTSVIINNTNNEVMTGNDVVLKCITDALPPANRYQFFHNANEILRHNSSSFQLVLTDTAASDGGNYSCRPYNDLGGGLVASVYLNVLVPVNISFITPNQTLEEGADTRLYCNATGNPSPNISWIKNDSPHQIVSVSEVLELTSVDRSVTGVFQCKADNGITISTATVFVNVNYKPEITNVTTKPETWIGKTVTIECIARGNPRPDITWSRGNGVNTFTSHKVHSTLNITPATNLDFGIYTCNATNLLGETNKSISLLQQTKPGIPTVETTDIEGESMTVHWKAPADDGGHAITSYHVTVDDGSGTKKTCNTAGNETSCVINKIRSSADAYVVNVKAENGVGYGNTATVRLDVKQVQIKFSKEPCDIEVTTKGTSRYEEKTAAFITEIKRVYNSEKIIKLYGITVSKLRCGSITATFDMVFLTNETNYLEPLKKETENGKLGTFDVEKSSIKEVEEPEEETGFNKFWDSLPLGAKVGFIIGLCLLVILIVYLIVMCFIKCRKNRKSSGSLETGIGMKNYSNKAYDTETENGLVITKKQPQGETEQRNGHSKQDMQTGEKVKASEDVAGSGENGNKTLNSTVDLAAISTDADAQNSHYIPRARRWESEDYLY